MFGLRGHNKRPNRPDVTKMPPQDEAPPNKIARNNSAPVIMRGDVDPNSSDHVVAMTQLKEQIASLQKQMTQKNSELINKDKMITELKANNFTTENELRNKLKSIQKEHEDKVDFLNNRISGLLKEVAGLSKSAKKSKGFTAVATSGGDNNSSGTDSPSLQ